MSTPIMYLNTQPLTGGEKKMSTVLLKYIYRQGIVDLGLGAKEELQVV